MTDNKAYWKRRALRAEAELENIKRVRSFEHEQEISMCRENSMQAVALREIQDILTELKQSAPTAGLI